MFRTVVAAIALLLRPLKANAPHRTSANPLARVRANGLTFEPRAGR